MATTPKSTSESGGGGNATARESVSGGRTDSRENWAPHAAHAYRQRIVLLGVQAGGTVLVTIAAASIAYLAVYSWPASLGKVRQSEFDIFGVLAGMAKLLQTSEFRPYLVLAFWSSLLFALIFHWLGLYKVDSVRVEPFRKAGTVFRGSILACVVTIGIGSTYLDVQHAQQLALERLAFFTFFSMLVFWGALLLHSGVLILVMIIRALGLGRRNIAIIGREKDALRLSETIRSQSSNYNFKGIILLSEGQRVESLPRAGHLGHLDAAINDHFLNEIVLASDPGELSQEQRLNLARTCWKLGVTLRMITPFFPYFHTRGEAEFFGDAPLLRVERVGLYSTWPQFVKRTLDLSVSAAALIILAPVFLFVGILIKLDSLGPVFFIQERPGLYGRVFRMIKFRSMRADADPALHREAQRKLITEGRPSADENGDLIYGKVAADPRVTRLGRFLRRTSIDELPNLINVVRGEMSLVGPRPSVFYELENYSEWHRQRLNIKPGITGLWQISGRSTLTFDQMVELDLKYIEEWSLWLDLSILLKTAPALLRTSRAA